MALLSMVVLPSIGINRFLQIKFLQSSVVGLQKLLSVYIELELKSQFLGRFAAKYHAVHKYLKIVHDRTVGVIYLKSQGYGCIIIIYFQHRLFHREVYPVMYVKI